jgi:acetyltransferase-like isoleucine patch superfamily enzyme
MLTLFSRLWAYAEFAVVALLGKIFGVSVVVRYLRNPNPRITVRLLRTFGAKVGDRVTIKRALVLDNAAEDENSAGDLSHLTIGDNCYIGEGVYLDLADRIHLDDAVVISAQVSIVTHADCNRAPYLSRAFPRRCGPVRIERGAWIGFGATVLHGTTVGAHAVVAANALLRSNAAPKTVYVGTPAAPQRHLNLPKRFKIKGA